MFRANLIEEWEKVVNTYGIEIIKQAQVILDESRKVRVKNYPRLFPLPSTSS